MIPEDGGPLSPETHETQPAGLDEIELFQRPRGPLPPGLYLVATPIGNLEDITLRGIRVLREADRIACEDTRQTQKLLNHFAIKTRTVSYHQHNEAERAAELLELLKAGGRVAVVSDAGTPGVADPGALLTRAAIAAAVPVIAVPGANAAVTALVAGGLGTERFRFNGFLPSKSGERRTALEGLRDAAGRERTTEIFYETPHRIAEALADVEAVFGPAEPVVLARELTKLHEEFLRGTVAEVRAALAGRESVRGEMVLLLAPGDSSPGNPAGELSLGEMIRALITGGLSEKNALKQAARERGMGKSELYREWQRVRGRRDRPVP